MQQVWCCRRCVAADVVHGGSRSRARRPRGGAPCGAGYPIDVPAEGAGLVTYCIMAYHLPLLIGVSLRRVPRPPPATSLAAAPSGSLNDAWPGWRHTACRCSRPCPAAVTHPSCSQLRVLCLVDMDQCMLACMRLCPGQCHLRRMLPISSSCGDMRYSRSSADWWGGCRSGSAPASCGAAACCFRLKCCALTPLVSSGCASAPSHSAEPLGSSLRGG